MKEEYEPLGFSLCVGQVSSVDIQSTSLLVVLLFSHALCITGRCEVDKSSGAAVLRDQGAAAFEAKTTFFTTPKLGGSPKRA